MNESLASSIFLLAFLTLVTLSYLSYKNNKISSKDNWILAFMSVPAIFSCIYLCICTEQLFSRNMLLEKIIIALAIYFIKDGHILYSIIFSTSCLIMIVMTINVHLTLDVIKLKITK